MAFLTGANIATYASISASDLAYLAADKPILGSQAIPAAPYLVKWHNSGSDTDRTDALYPARRGYDGLAGFITKPTTVSADKTWYFTISSGAWMEFDFLALVNHNLGTIGGLTVTLELDDAAGFGTCVSVPIATPSTNSRIIKLDLFHTGATALRYSTIQYARLKLTRGATNYTPEIGEIILGRRLQMHAKPDVAYDSYSLHGTKEMSATQGGVIYSSVFTTGQRRLAAQWMDDNTTRQAAVASWVAATSYKTRPFVWVENPYSAPASWHYMVPDDGDFDYPLEENPSIRTFRIEASEQGPDNCYLARGLY